MMRGFCPRGFCPEGAYVLMELCLEGVLSEGVLSEGVLSGGGFVLPSLTDQFRVCLSPFLTVFPFRKKGSFQMIIDR